MKMLVVSAETVSGGKKVNELRIKNGLQPLHVHSVELLPDRKLEEEEEDKISSSNDRLRLLGTLLTKPEPKIYLPPRPYIIGLTGGIASGKSSVSERLRLLGAGVIDCDKIAHQLYQRGTNVYTQLIEVFGSNILGGDGEVNRKALGEIVFNDKEMLQELNKLLWPEILEKSKQLSYELCTKGCDVVVLEAAVLLKAGWEKDCHEIWACLVPYEEAVKRLQNRNKLTVSEANARLSAQINNSQLVAKANVVICTLWRPEYTQKQVERAWSELKGRIPS